MIKDVMIVIAFIIAVVIFCKVFNILMMKRYKNANRLENNVLKLTYGCYIDNIRKLELAGVGNDGNSDYAVSKAIKKIEMTDDVRIKVNE